MRCTVISRWLACLALALGLAGCGGNTSARPGAAGGVLDLQAWDFPRDGVVPLDGQWELRWGRFDDPAVASAVPAALVEVPAAWNQQPVDRYGARGFADYRLTVRCRQPADLALNLPVQHSAAHWFVNGRLVARQGSPGTSAATAEPAALQQIVPLEGMACPLRIVVHVSNFDSRRGGLLRSVSLGTQLQVRQEREHAVMRDLAALGGLTLMGTLPLVFFLMRRKDRTPLYFALFCLSLAVGIGMTGTRALQPVMAPLGWDAYLRVVFISWHASVAWFVLFVRCVYPKDLRRTPVRLIAGWALVSVLVVLVTPASVFTFMTFTLQTGAALAMLYLGVALALAVRRGRRSAGVLLAGVTVLALAVIHDTVQFQHLQRISLVSYALFLFVMAPAVLLARRFSRALSAEELRFLEQRERADLMVRATNAGVLDWDGTTGETVYSDRYREMLGYPIGPGAVDMPPFWVLLHPEDHDRVNSAFMRQLRDRSVTSGVRANELMDYRLHRADGAQLWVRAEAISVCGTDGRTLRYICSFIDITDTKLQEAALSNRVKFIGDLFDSVPLELALRDTQGRHVYVNRRWEQSVGIARDHAIGRTLAELSQDPTAAATHALDQEALAMHPGEVPPQREYDFDGRRFMQTRTVMADAQGRQIGVLVASLDISDKYATEQSLRTEQRRLDLVVRGARVGIVDWDGHSHLTYYSPLFRELRGYPGDADTSGWPDYFKVMIHPDDRERVKRRWVPFIKGKGPEGPRAAYYSPEEYRLLRADGGYVWVQVSGMAVRDDKGFVVRWIAAVLDISERRAQAALLEAQHEALKENVRLREEVERIGRHDIKTPLNSIVAVPRLLREERKLGPEADELLGIVERAGYRILSMVNLSLDLYKMEQGSYVLRPDAVDIGELVDKVVADVRMQADSRQVRLRLHIGEVPFAWAEELLCYSLLANLLKNAVEASPDGGTVTISARAAEAGTVLLQVHNLGEVSEAMQRSFFQKYATYGKAGGTGLGAYSARLMARVQDGEALMESSAAQGTTLSVRLPAAPEGAVPASVRHAAERRGTGALLLSALPATRVLLVDDDEYNLMIVRRFLPSPPFTVDTAINGKVALAAAELQWPDLIFMDLDMPVMGGLEAVARLRAMEAAAALKRCAIIALSSHDDDETRQRALAAGFDRYLAKPVTRDTVQHTLLALDGQIGDAARTPSARVAGSDATVFVDADIASLLPDFLASRRQLVDAMDVAARAEDRAEVRRIAHQLAGSLGLYGFHWAGEQALWLEKNVDSLSTPQLCGLSNALREHLAAPDVRAGAGAQD